MSQSQCIRYQSSLHSNKTILPPKLLSLTTLHAKYTLFVPLLNPYNILMS